MTRSPISRPGRRRGNEPDASTTSLASIVRPSTWMDGPGASLPVPWTTSILRSLTRPVTPLTSLATIFSWKAVTSSQFGFPEASMPHSVDRFTLSMTAADCNRALVGMQPRSRHVPPRRSSFSTRATRFPSSAARRAAE